MKESIICADHLYKHYKKQMAVNDVSFNIPKGNICGLVGPNGAGKTTIMKMLGGLVIPTKGSISLFDSKTSKELAHARSRMSFIIETPYEKQYMSARQNLTKQCMQKGVPDLKRVDEVLEMVGLSDTKRKIVKQFSMGMKQRLGIAGSLLSRPEAMVLDEPINGLDPEGIIEIRELLVRLNKEYHTTIIISSHILPELANICTDYIFLKGGEIKQYISADELHHICQEYYQINTDNNSLAAAILQEKLKITDVEVENDGSLRIHERLDELELISRTLYQNGVTPISSQLHETNLEEYYIKLVGE